MFLNVFFEKLRVSGKLTEQSKIRAGKRQNFKEAAQPNSLSF